MYNDNFAIPRQLDIQFGTVTTEFNGMAECFQSVLRAKARPAAMCDAQHWLREKRVLDAIGQPTSRRKVTSRNCWVRRRPSPGSERGAAWLAHQSGGLGVVGSNPAAPTIAFDRFAIESNAKGPRATARPRRCR